MDKYEIDEILNLAIMSKTPYFIVEGVDDIFIYEAIAKSAEIECEIYAVSMIERLAGGNNGVVEAMKALDGLRMATGRTVEHYVLGIVDRDARFYRQEIPTLPSILSLNCYSIESHFVSKHTIKPAIDRLTRISSGDEIDIDSIFPRIEQGILDVYYFSLEALKSAVTPGYQAIVGYSSSIGRRKDQNTTASLQAIKGDLDRFATSMNIVATINSMREFVKGKWLLIAFSEELFKEVELLTSGCKNSRIKQCRMCELDNSAPCLYQLRDGFNKNSLYSIIKDFVDIPDFEYIRTSMKDTETSAMI